MKKPSKTGAELEASIRVEMEDICDWPTDMMISVLPDGDSWKVAVVQEGSLEDTETPTYVAAWHGAGPGAAKRSQ